MADRTDETAPQAFPVITGGDAAPMIFADGVLALGLWAGVAEIEFSARALTPLPTGITNADARVVVRLRLSATGFAGLKDAIQKIELMLAPSDAKPN